MPGGKGDLPVWIRVRDLRGIQAADTSRCRTAPRFNLSRYRTMRRSLFPYLLPLFLLLHACGPTPAPDAVAPSEAVDQAMLAEVAAERITAQVMAQHIGFLASDEMRGRDTPSPELEEAADYLVSHFESVGVAPAGDDGSYVQRWPYERLILAEGESHAYMEAGGDRWDWAYAYDYFGIPGPPGPVEGAPVYAGSPAVAAAGLPSETAGSPLVVGLPDGLGPEFGMAIQAGMQAGAAGMVFLMDEETDASATFQLAAALEGGAAGQMPFPIIGLRHEVGTELLERIGADPGAGATQAQVLEDVVISFRSTFGSQVEDVPNVVAQIRGSDPELADEYVVLTAHFDHVGVGPPDEQGDSIYSGADDNASGTSALMQVAEAFAALPEAPARSVLFLAVSGEEKGLLGSAYFAGNPTIPQESMVANLNMDMVSRNAPDTIYAVGEEYSSLGELARQVAADHPELGLVVAPDPEPEEQAFLRSDHYSFVEIGIPSLMLTTWLHDDYHLPSDRPELSDADKAARVAQFTFLMAHRLATERPLPDWNEEGRQLLQELGVTPRR